MRRRLAVITVALAALLAPSGAATAATWVVRGAGWGHGVGLSAWGAYGYGKHGFDYREIIDHYFAHLRITKLRGAPTVRVLLDASKGDVRFSRAHKACGRKLNPSRSYVAARGGSGVTLESSSGRTLERCGRTLRADGRGPIGIAGLGRYRGMLNVVAAGSGLNVVNDLDVNDYVRGSVPAEVPPSWPMATLEAMAVAARSIALSTDVGGEGFELYPDTRTQLYRGVKAETKRTDRAVHSTASRVATYRGEVAQTTYFSSSGGRTESRFLGGPRVPYLVSVKDPYDRYSPLHRWRTRFSQSEIDAKLGGLVDGSLRKVKANRSSESPRIDSAKLIGTGGATRVGGDELAAALGLYSRWAYFKRR
jgi:stage II sporulation protein D